MKGATTDGLRAAARLSTWGSSAAVAMGLAALGLSAYAYLAFAGRALGPDAFAPLSVLWVIVNTIILGLLAPIEQETGRLVSGHRSAGLPDARVVRVAALHAAGLVLLVAVLALPARAWLGDVLFRGQAGLVDVCVAATAIYALAYLSRGVLAGRARFARYGVQLGVEGAVRGVAATVFLIASLTWVEGLAWVLVVAPAIAVALTWPPRETHARDPEPDTDGGTPAHPRAVTTAGFLRRLVLLIGTAAVSSLMINLPPLLAELLDPGGTQTAIILAAVVVARLPLFAFAAVQAVAIPRLAAALVNGRHAFLDAFRQVLIMVVMLAVCGFLVCGLLGPEIVRLAFGDEFTVDRGLALLLAASGSAFMVASLLSQTIIAQGNHRLTLLAWAAAAAVMALVTGAIDDVVAQIAVGSLAGSLAAVTTLGAALRHGVSRISLGSP